ncbi:protein-disulfide reductase DsbD domain-containing protein [Taibaiella soli]|uniref:Thiol:disulfide interchange protein DsbD N-terminal domain-containing protein n=1 Tax=Taibaiella soli TaxID=1649169 RepID=A0A2W2B3C2_9BACT|nr:protein-disulfide reductase DsbD domain-containing protein [Taibaiella soli]PZF74784.1 hypothetical protein DN068_00890 [Taibaiella soli]
MKQLLQAILLAGAMIGLRTEVKAQDPTTWTYEVKKKSATEYDLVFHLQLQAGFHIWALNPGGDGLQIVPSFTFDKNANLELVGKVHENGRPTRSKMEGIEGSVNYFSGSVDYIQTVKMKKPGKVTGKHEYQVCNDMMCLPPKDKNFVFDVK